MQVASAYILVVVVWSTTPLAIHFSNSTLSFSAAITLRMFFAFVCCYALLKVFRLPLIKTRRDWLVFAIASVGLFPNMLIIYWAAQYVPSGLMSVIMGVYPFWVGLFSRIILKEQVLTSSKVFALILALLGLVVIHLDQMSVGPKAMYGVLALVLVCAIWGISSVYLKQLAGDINPLRQGTGSILVALPFFAVSWFIFDGTLPQGVDHKSLFGVTYLVIMGSVVSHTLYFYILRHCLVSTVSLVTLITPVLAIIWGVFLAGEVFTGKMAIGSILILLALAVYQNIFKLVRQYTWGRVKLGASRA